MSHYICANCTLDYGDCLCESNKMQGPIKSTEPKGLEAYMPAPGTAAYEYGLDRSQVYRIDGRIVSKVEYDKMNVQLSNAPKFKKNDATKDLWHLMPEPALREVLLVLMDGAAKYGAFNWIDNAEQVDWTRLINSMERHFKDFKRGNDFDKESGRYELAHLACNALFLLTYSIKKIGNDNRRKE